MDSPTSTTPIKDKIKKEGGGDLNIFDSQMEDCVVWGSPHDSITYKLVYVPDRTPTSALLGSPEPLPVIKKSSRRILNLSTEEPDYMLELEALAERVKRNAEKMKARKAALDTETEDAKNDIDDDSDLSSQNEPRVTKLNFDETSNESLSDIFNDDADEFLLKCTREIDEICPDDGSTNDFSESCMLGHSVTNLRQISPESKGFITRRTSPRFKCRSLRNGKTGVESPNSPQAKFPKTENKFCMKSKSSTSTSFFRSAHVVESQLNKPATDKNINSNSSSTVTNQEQILPDQNVFAIRRTSPRANFRSLQNIKNHCRDVNHSSFTLRTSPKNKFHSLHNIKCDTDNSYDTAIKRVPIIENKFGKQSSCSFTPLPANECVAESHIHWEETLIINRNSTSKSEAPDESLEAVLQSFVDEDIELLSQAFPESAKPKTKISSTVNQASVTDDSSSGSFSDLNTGTLGSSVSKSCNALDKVVDKTRQTVRKTLTSTNSGVTNSMPSSESHGMTASQYVRRCTAEQIEQKRREAKLRLENKRKNFSKLAAPGASHNN